MIITIRQYLEALANSEGRFRTLEKVCAVKDADGGPVFAMPGNGLVDMEVTAGGTRHTLRCPLRSDAGAANRLRALRDRDKGLGSRYFTEWELLDGEILLFDAAGVPFEVDILARITPRGEKAAEFLQKASSDGDTAAVLAAMKSLGELSEWAENAGRRGIAAGRLLVASRGEEVFVTGLSARDESPRIALAFLFTAVAPERFAETGLPLISGYDRAGALAEKLCAAASEAGFAEPAQILAGDVAGGIRRLAERRPEEISALGGRLTEALGTSEPETMEETGGYSWQEDDAEGIKCVKDGAGWRYVDRLDAPISDTLWLSASPFREGRAEVEADTGRGLIDKEGRAVLEPVYEELAWDEYWGLVAVMAEGRWSLLDRDGILLTGESYDWLGECCEGMILAQKGGMCGFIDAEGREVIPFVYDDATSFFEGCAFATAGEESFYIDGRGRKL